jgi:hypothetical protein
MYNNDPIPAYGRIGWDFGQDRERRAMGLRRSAVVVALCGAAVIAAWLADARYVALFHAAAAPLEGSPVTSATAELAPLEAAKGADAVPAGDSAVVGAALPVGVLPSETVASPVASVPPDPVPSRAPEPAIAVEAVDDCALSEICIDQYLWSLYQRTPKLDTVKLSKRVKVTVKTKRKIRTVTKTVAKVINEDFTWKDAKAAEKAGMSLMEYVIGGMDRSFKLKLYHALRAMDAAGLEPGITSAFRDDYRQSIVSGKKAAIGSSYHGGSRRGGYGRGLAADLVSVKGETRAQRQISSGILWQWIDAHGQEYGIGRPYRGRDPPHVGPIDGQEYADKRGRRNVAQTHKRHGPVESTNPGNAKGAKTTSR